jgi:adenylate cyclase class 2
MLEQEVKLSFDSADTARGAVRTAGATLVLSRRLIEDVLFDTPDGRIGRSGRALRLRRDAGRSFLTVKGPLQPGPVKTRDEIETTVGDAATTEGMLAALGYLPVFRSEKYREEYALGAARLTVDEAPVGVFVEIEGTIEEIGRVGLLLGRTTADFRVESYPALWRQWCAERGMPPGDMVFDARTANR